MSQIVLLLCLSLIAYLIGSDIKRRKSVSAAVWLPTLLLMMLGSRPMSLWLGGNLMVGEMGNNAERSPIDQIFHLSILTGSLIVACSRRVNWSKLLRDNTALVAFYAFFAVSILWSGDPSGSLKRWIKDLGTIFVVAVILTEKDPREAMRAVYFRCASLLFPLSVVFIRYFPSIGRTYTIAGEPMYTGVTTQKNTLGELVLVLCLFLVWDCVEARQEGKKHGWLWLPWDRVLLLILGMYLLNISQSKTALLCLTTGSFLLLRGELLKSRMVSLIALVTALCVPFLLFTAQQFSSVIAPLIEAMGRNMTFTGRTDIWEHITSTTVNPLIGAGFWNFWGGEGGQAISDAMRTIVPNAHCGYLDIYLDGGLIGLFLLFSLLIACGRRLSKTKGVSRFQLVRFAFLIAMIFYNLSESTYARPSTSWVTMLLLTTAFPMRLVETVARRKAEPEPVGSFAVAPATFKTWTL